MHASKVTSYYHMRHLENFIFDTCVVAVSVTKTKLLELIFFPQKAGLLSTADFCLYLIDAFHLCMFAVIGSIYFLQSENQKDGLFNKICPGVLIKIISHHESLDKYNIKNYTSVSK